jgi:predicted nucleic acid-binding protein
LGFGRRLGWLRRAWFTGAVTRIVCRGTVAELLRGLAYPRFRLTDDERETLLGEYLPYAEVAHLPHSRPALPIDCRDRDDGVFLPLALAAGADLLISGDEALTTLASVFPVASPAELRRKLGDAG